MSATVVEKRTCVNGIDVTHALEWGRGDCPCGKASKITWFCPFCHTTIGVPEHVTVPSITLPVDTVILRRDKKNKNTGSHAKVLAPETVHIVDIATVTPAHRQKRARVNESFQLPVAATPENAVVLFPSKKSVPLPELDKTTAAALQYLIIIDSTWNSTRAILELDTLVNFKHVRLANAPEESRFWRVPPNGKHFLSTIEAMAQAYKELPGTSDETKGECGQLMYFFENMLHVITERRKERYGANVPLVYDKDQREEHRKKWYPNGSKKNRRRRPNTIDK